VKSDVIDAHAMLGRENHLALDGEELLRRMDAHGIATALARPVGAELVVDHVAGNDRVLKAHARIRGLVTANPWFGDRALDELKRCRDLGAVGLYLHPSRQGFMPVEPVAVPLLEFAVSTGWPVLFHTGTYIYSDILAVAEVARRYPQAPFIAGFSGFTDMWFELPGVFAETPNLYMDTALIWGGAVEEIVASCGVERVLFGSAEPRDRYAAALRRVERNALSAEQRNAILGGNARRIFRLP